MSSIKEYRLIELFKNLQLKEAALKDFKVEQFEDKIKISYKNHCYYVTLEEKEGNFYWVLKPFKNTVFQVKVDNDTDFIFLLYAIEEDLEFRRQEEDLKYRLK